ncbi:fimbria/pilus outer membrane usher protein [Escherichia coli]
MLWDDGITAFLLNWQANANRTEQRGNGQSSGRDDFWLSLEPGLNIGAWRIRNLSSWHKNAGKAGKWELVCYTRAERGLNGIKSRLTVGESYTPSDIF